jgi:hypothetical protein
MGKRNRLERRQVSLKGSCRLLQTSQPQGIREAQRALVVALVDATIRSPGARWLPVLGVAIGGEPPRLADEAERGEARQPLKPRRRIGFDMQFAFLRYSCSQRLLAHCIRAAGACETARVVGPD